MVCGILSTIRYVQLLCGCRKNFLSPLLFLQPHNNWMYRVVRKIPYTKFATYSLNKRSWGRTIEVRNMSSYQMLWINLIIKHCVSTWITYILLWTILYFKLRVKKSSKHKESTWTSYLLNLFPLLMQTACTKMERVFIVIKQTSPQMIGAPLDTPVTLWIFWMTNPAMESSAVRKCLIYKVYSNN